MTKSEAQAILNHVNNVLTRLDQWNANDPTDTTVSSAYAELRAIKEMAVAELRSPL